MINNKKRILAAATCMICMLAGSLSALAQSPQDKVQTEPMTVVTLQHGAQAGGVAGEPGSGTAVFISTEMGFGDKVVTGAPYSAQAITESVQTLGDGNRIVHNSTASVYRDSQGRTRRDQTMGAIGPWAASNAKPTIMIFDNVAGVHYFLDASSHTAQKLPFVHVSGPVTSATAKVTHTENFVYVTSTTSGDAGAPPPPPPPPGIGIGMGKGEYHFDMPKVAGATPKTESLGKQTIEGIEAEGTRTTLTLPAGAIGNEQPINMITERWYSADLQTVVMSKHSDPRSGDTTYRLTNINRSEPDASLFTVPADYTIQEGGAGKINMRVKKSLNEN